MRSTIVSLSKYLVVLFFLLSFGSRTSSAENSVIIDQVGPGSVEVRQSGEENSAQIHQNPDPLPMASVATKSPMPPPLGTPATIKGGDYQKTILQNPYTSPEARAEVLSKNNDASVPDAKKTVTDTKKTLLNEKRGSGNIQIYQQGTKNTAITSQKNTTNDLLIDQNGNDNTFDRTQSGNDNHSAIIQNGHAVEDK